MGIISKIVQSIQSCRQQENRFYPRYTLEEKSHFRELQSYFDSELSDQSITRGTIRDSIKDGRQGVECQPTDEAA